MKLAAFALATVATANEKKVPQRTPLQRLKTLRRFADEWTKANLNDRMATNFGARYGRNADRMETKFNRCGYYDADVQHGGPRPVG